MTEPSNSSPAQPSQPAEKSSPASLPEIINVIADRVDPLIRLVTTFYERRLAQRESEIKLAKYLSFVAVLIIALVVLSAAVLTYQGKVDGSTFGFLLGVVVGYMLTFVRDALRPPVEP